MKEHREKKEKIQKWKREERKNGEMEILTP